jgi:hypothetical protein
LRAKTPPCLDFRKFPPFWMPAAGCVPPSVQHMRKKIAARVRGLAAAPGIAVIVAASGLTVFAAPGSALADPAVPATPVAADRIDVGALGDSYASGAGTEKPANYVTAAEVRAGQHVDTIDPAHQSTQAPAWQALARLRQQHPDLDIELTLDAMLGATTGTVRAAVRPASAFEHPAQLGEANGKDVVSLSLGGDQVDISGWAQVVAVATDETSAAAYPGLLARVRDPKFAAALQQTYEAVLANLNPGGTLIVTNYPLILPDAVPGASPGSTQNWSISSSEARLVNDFTKALNAVIARAAARATARASALGTSLHAVDLQAAFAGNLLFSARPAVRSLVEEGDFAPDSFHPNDLGQRLIAARILPALDLAVTRSAAARAAARAGRPLPDVPDGTIAAGGAAVPAGGTTSAGPRPGAVAGAGPMPGSSAGSGSGQAGAGGSAGAGSGAGTVTTPGTGTGTGVTTPGGGGGTGAGTAPGGAGTGTPPAAGGSAPGSQAPARVADSGSSDQPTTDPGSITSEAVSAGPEPDAAFADPAIESTVADVDTADVDTADVDTDDADAEDTDDPGVSSVSDDADTTDADTADATADPSAADDADAADGVDAADGTDAGGADADGADSDGADASGGADVGAASGGADGSDAGASDSGDGGASDGDGGGDGGDGDGGGGGGGDGGDGGGGDGGGGDGGD